jgi:hypothetical protein
MTKQEFVEIFREEIGSTDDTMVLSFWEDSFKYDMDSFSLRKQLRSLDPLTIMQIQLMKSN